MDNNFSKYDSLDVLKLYDDPQFNSKQHVIFKTPEVVVSLQKQSIVHKHSSNLICHGTNVKQYHFYYIYRVYKGVFFSFK